MEQVIREVSGDEAKLLALQFLGQNLGEMKELDKNIVSSLKPIAGSINPNNILQTIPQSQQQSIAAPVSTAPELIASPAPIAQPIAAAGPVVIPSLASLQTPVQQVASAPAVVNDHNQLELNFNASPYSEQIFTKLEKLEKKIDLLVENQQQLIEVITEFKKKYEVSLVVE